MVQLLADAEAACFVYVTILGEQLRGRKNKKKTKTFARQKYLGSTSAEKILKKYVFKSFAGRGTYPRS